MPQVTAYKVDTLVGVKPDAIVALKVPNENKFELFVTSRTGVPFPLKLTSTSDAITDIINTDGELNISGNSTVTINISDTLLNTINSALQAGDNISELINNSGYITLLDVPEFVPSDYDLNEFTNISLDPFARISEVGTGSIKSNESLTLAKRKDDVLYNIIDKFTGEEITLSKVNGTPTVDGIIYFQLGSEYFKRNFTKLNPYMFGAKADGINNDTSALQSAINFSSANNVVLELKGNFLSNTLTISDDIELQTVCKIQSIVDNDILIIDGAKVNHTGSLTLRGFTRNTLNRGIVLRNGVLNSTFDKVYISNTGLGVDYEASGNNNIVAWNLLDVRSTSYSATALFTKGSFVSNTTLFNIGEVTTDIPILTNMGTIIVNGEVYPIVEKPEATNTYYVGNFHNLPSSGVLAYYVGGGVVHRKHNDNGAIEYKTLRLFSIAGSSITVQSLYGVTVNGGEIEGCGTNVIVGGIFMNGANPETIYSIRSLFEGLHTEANDANKPFVYTLKNSMVTFKGCIMGNGIVVGAPETGTNFQSGYGTDRTSNYYYGKPNEDFPTIRPNDPTFKVYKDLSIGSIVYLELQDLIPMMSYAGDLRVNYVCQGEYNMLNIPLGQTRTLRVTPLGWNTLNGETAYEDIVVTGIEGVKEYKITFLLVDKNFTYYINADQTDFALNDDVVHIAGDTMTGALTTTELISQGNVTATESLFGKYTQLIDPTSSNFINSGSDATGSFFNSNASYRFQTQAGTNLLTINKDTGNINAIGDFITNLDLRARYSRLTDSVTGNFLNSGADATGAFINSATNTRFLTNNSFIPLTLSGQTAILGYQPTVTAAAEFDVLTRNRTTGVIERKDNTFFPSMSLTDGFIPKASTSNTLVNSIISDNGSGVSIYTATTPFLSITNGTDFVNSGVDTVTNFINSSKGLRFITDNSYEPLSLLGQTLKLGYQPTTSVGTYDILTRNISTGIVEKLPSGSFLTGTGTYGIVPLFIGTSEVGSSIITQPNVNTLKLSTVGIGSTASPLLKSIQFSRWNSDLAGYIGIIDRSTEEAYTDFTIGLLGSGGSLINPLTIKGNTSNLLINTTTDNGVDKLQVNGSILGTSFKTPTGISTEFLKADGSVDTNTYLTSSSNYWTKTGDDIKNNNIGNTQIQIQPTKQVQFLNSAGTQIGFIDENGTYRAGTASQYVTVGLLGGNTWMSMVRSQASMGIILGNPQVSQPFITSSTNYFGTSYIAGSDEVAAVANAEHSFNIGNAPGDGITSGIFRIGRTRLQSTVPVKYATDLSGSYDARSLVDKEYADTKAPLISPTFTGIPIAPTAALATNTTQIATTAFVNAAVNSYIIQAQRINTNFTLALTDAFTVIPIFSGGSYTITIPTNASVAFPIGTKIEITQLLGGTGQTSFVGAGVTLLGNTKLYDGDYANLIKVGVDTWTIAGISKVAPVFSNSVTATRYVATQGSEGYGTQGYNKFCDNGQGAMIQMNGDGGGNVPLFKFNPVYPFGGNPNLSDGRTVKNIDFLESFIATSGNVSATIYNIEPTINQTGGASGIIRGIYINPTLTSSVDFRAIEVTEGKVIIPNGTAANEAVNKSQLDLVSSDFLLYSMSF